MIVVGSIYGLFVAIFECDRLRCLTLLAALVVVAYIRDRPPARARALAVAAPLANCHYARAPRIAILLMSLTTQAASKAATTTTTRSGIDCWRAFERREAAASLRSRKRAIWRSMFSSQRRRRRCRRCLLVSGSSRCKLLLAVALKFFSVGWQRVNSR